MPPQGLVWLPSIRRVHAPSLLSGRPFTAGSPTSTDSQEARFSGLAKNFGPQQERKAEAELPSPLKRVMRRATASCTGRGTAGLNEIGIGEAVARLPLPHHRAYGSVHGGSIGYASSLRLVKEGQAI